MKRGGPGRPLLISLPLLQAMGGGDAACPRGTAAIALVITRGARANPSGAQAVWLGSDGIGQRL
jgi:hypothetical protein